MKITLTNIEYSDKYKSLAAHALLPEITVEIPDTTTENNINMVVYLAIVKDHSRELAEGIENTEFTIS